MCVGFKGQRGPRGRRGKPGSPGAEGPKGSMGVSGLPVSQVSEYYMVNQMVVIQYLDSLDHYNVWLGNKYIYIYKNIYILIILYYIDRPMYLDK